MQRLKFGPYAARFLFTSSLIAASSQASAFFDADLGIGRRNAKWNQDSTTTNTTSDLIKVAAHLDPIPLVPVSFGLAAYSETWKVSNEDQGMSSLKSYSLVPEVTAWLPLDDLKPYARVGYSILSAYVGDTDFGKLYLGGTGLHVGAGLDWSVPLVPMLSVFGELEYSSETLKLAKDKVGDTDISGSFKAPTVTSTALIVGAKLGI